MGSISCAGDSLPPEGAKQSVDKEFMSHRYLKRINKCRSLFVTIGLACAAWLGGSGVAAAQPTLEVILHFFGYTPNDGVEPQGGLMFGPDNALYGTTPTTASGGAGTVFKIGRDGTGYQIIHNFTNSPDGASAQTALRLGADGLIYGTTYAGGTNNVGVMFRMSLNGGFYQIVHQFTTNADEPQQPLTPLFQAPDGTFYGTGSAGGTNGMGTIFKINPDGSDLQVLHSFGATADGSSPNRAGLILANDGLLYGETPSGGTGNLGTIFRLATNGGSYQVVHSFTNAPDGGSPVGMTLAQNGSLYIATAEGGSKGLGAIVKMNTDGNGWQVLHSFTNNPDGGIPLSGPMQAWDGAIYGMTYSGGYTVQGTIYRLQPDGSAYTNIYTFTNYAAPPYHLDGFHPQSVLVQGTSVDNSGVLYGTTLDSSTNLVGVGGSVFGLVISPGLTITPINGQNVVFWPGYALNFELQTTTNLLAGPWIPATNGTSMAGLMFTNGTFPPTSFFRLIWPQ